MTPARGETAKFDGPYYLLRLISLAQRLGVPAPQVGRGDAPLNVVPVDFVVEAITAAAGDRRAVGETLHLVDPEPTTAGEMTALLSREYGGREPAFRVPAALSRESLRLPGVPRLVGGMPRESVAYIDHPVRFDLRCAAEVLGRHALAPPGSATMWANS